jgi:adenylate kinase
LIGLPGAGKTTLSRSLSEWLRCPEFVLGDALRAQAAVDTDLHDLLARGELAPESVVIDLVREAAANAATTGLVVDGFPRHVAQLSIANSLFKQWIVLWLDIDLPTAVARLALRTNCGGCGYVRGTLQVETCPRCGSRNWTKRGEDSPNILSHRLAMLHRMLSEMIAEMHEVPVYRLDAAQSVECVRNQAILQLSDPLR